MINPPMGCMVGGLESGQTGAGISDMAAAGIMNGVLPPGQSMALGGAGIDLNQMAIDEEMAE